MYVRMITYSIRPSVSLEQATIIYHEMLSFLQPLPGYRGLSLLLNEEAHQAVSLSYWQDQESATEAGSKVLPVLMGRTQELVDRPPEVAGYEIVDQNLPTDQPESG